MTPIELENSMLALLEKMQVKYQSMLTTIEPITLTSEDYPALDEATELLRKEMAELEHLDRETATMKQRYRESRPHASSAVSQATAELSAVMESFLVKLNLLENAAAKHRQAIMPQLDASVRSVHMKSAYGKYSAS